MYHSNDGFPLPRILMIVGLIIGAWFVIGSLQPSETKVSAWSGQNPWGAMTGGNQQVTSGGFVGAAVQQSGRGFSSNEMLPTGNPLLSDRTVMTQGYGVGTHAPAAAWGAIDLAIDGDGDGIADPKGSYGQPIYATHSGVVKVTPNSVPAGNHIWVINDAYKTGYAHLESFAVESGQTVRAGDLIGYMGSTGQSSGPHLDYQIWKWENGNWINQNPLNYNVFQK